jgi:hypothetical protein
MPRSTAIARSDFSGMAAMNDSDIVTLKADKVAVEPFLVEDQSQTRSQKKMHNSSRRDV